MPATAEKRSSKSGLVKARVRPEVKECASEVFSSLGLSTSGAINLFLEQVCLNGGIPFPIEIPNETTRKAIDEAVGNSDELPAFSSVDELRKRYGM